MSKLVNLYIDWQDKSTYVGVGKIISRVYNLPVVCLDDKCFQPKRCLVEIWDSDYYNQGEQIHFVVPFAISEEEARVINRKTDRARPLSYSLWDEALLHDNPIVDTRREIELRNDLRAAYKKYVYNGKPIPRVIFKSLEKRAEKNRKRKDYDLSNK